MSGVVNVESAGRAPIPSPQEPWWNVKKLGEQGNILKAPDMYSAYLTSLNSSRLLSNARALSLGASLDFPDPELVSKKDNDWLISQVFLAINESWKSEPGKKEKIFRYYLLDGMAASGIVPSYGTKWVQGARASLETRSKTVAKVLRETRARSSESKDRVLEAINLMQRRKAPVVQEYDHDFEDNYSKENKREKDEKKPDAAGKPGQSQREQEIADLQSLEEKAEDQRRFEEQKEKERKEVRQGGAGDGARRSSGPAEMSKEKREYLEGIPGGPPANLQLDANNVAEFVKEYLDQFYDRNLAMGYEELMSLKKRFVIKDIPAGAQIANYRMTTKTLYDNLAIPLQSVLRTDILYKGPDPSSAKYITKDSTEFLDGIRKWLLEVFMSNKKNAQKWREFLEMVQVYDLRPRK